MQTFLPKTTNNVTGEVEKSIEGLDQSIECCEAWKENYNDAAATHNRFSEVKWLLDRSSIFAQIDAFVQRCKDLKEVLKPLPCLLQMSR